MEANMTNSDKYDAQSFTKEERVQVQALHQRLDDKFDEIALFLAKALGYNEANPRCREEAEEAIDRWEEDVEMADNPIEPTDQLQLLLRDYHEISEQIMDIRDDAIARGGFNAESLTTKHGRLK
jgi:hypothetical protein